MNVYDLVITKYYRDYCAENGVAFSDRDAAVLLSDEEFCHAPLCERYVALDNLKKITEDEELRESLRKCMAAFSNAYSEFCKNDDGLFYYKVELPDDTEWSFEQSFPNWLGAFEYGKENCDSFIFRISKCPLYDNKSAENRKHGAITYAAYNYYGNIYFIDNMTERSFFKYLPDSRFTIVNPFECGDIVRNPLLEKIYVVEEDREEWNKRMPFKVDFYRSCAFWFYLDMEDTEDSYETNRFGHEIAVICIGDDGTPVRETFPPFRFEKVDNYLAAGEEADLLRQISADLCSKGK